MVHDITCFKGKLAIQMASRMTDQLRQCDVYITDSIASAIFDRLVDALLDQPDDELIGLCGFESREDD